MNTLHKYLTTSKTLYFTNEISESEFGIIYEKYVYYYYCSQDLLIKNVGEALKVDLLNRKLAAIQYG